MRIKNLDLILAILIVAINVGWTQVLNRPLFVGIILALPLVFIFPGYTLTQILFRRRLSDQSSSTLGKSILRPHLKIGHPVDGIDQIVLSLGLSMALDVLVGFVLNIFPIGLQALSWTLSLGLLTTLFALLAAFLRRSDITKSAKIPRLRVTIYDYILLGLAILVTTTSIWLSIIRPIIPPPSFTQFWMLPVNQASKSCAVSIGIQSFEAASVTYRIVLTANGSKIDVWPLIKLDPRKEWVLAVPIISGPNKSMFIEARLYRVDKPNTIYRDVHLTFYVLMESKNSQVRQCSTAISSSG